MGITGERLKQIRRGSLLHDIGKMGIPDQILLKPGPLTASEYEIMKKHPVFAYEMLSKIEFLKPCLDIPFCHHERWDGTGYPRGLKALQIPQAARIFSVVDVWDALHSNRPYRQEWPVERITAYLAKQAGTQFDPAIVQTFVHMSLTETTI
jgi:HD-GYP domain-containing protein (c-di-GMP phosphodiesterase class II)